MDVTAAAMPSPRARRKRTNAFDEEEEDDELTPLGRFDSISMGQSRPTVVGRTKSSSVASTSSRFSRSPRYSARKATLIRGALDPVKKLRQKVNSVYTDILQVAICRLKAAEVQRKQPPTTTQKTKLQDLRHVWPHLLISPMIWLPFSLFLSRSSKPVTVSSKEKKKKRAMRTLATLDFSIGQGILRGRVRESESQETPKLEGGKSTDGENSDAVVLQNSEKLREAFRVAVSEAKLAQAQSLAASRDVQSLQMALERSKRSLQPANTGGTSPGSNRQPPRGGGGAKAQVATLREPQIKAQLLAQQEHLKQFEMSLKKELQEVASQTEHLRIELHRRQERAMTAQLQSDSACGVCAADELGWSPGIYVPSAISGTPQDCSNSRDPPGSAASPVASKHLSSSRVLPDISGSSSTPRQGGPTFKPVGVLAPRTLASSCEGRQPQRPLPNVPWRAGTAP